MTEPYEIRVLEWIFPGYEGAYTQFTLCPTILDGPLPNYADVYINQVATRDNTARAMQQPGQVHKFGPIDSMRAFVGEIISDRVRDGLCIELVDRDPRKCTDCEHFKFMHGPEAGGCVECRCTEEWPDTYDGDE